MIMPKNRTGKYWNYWQEMVDASTKRNTVELPALLGIADFEGKKCLDVGSGVGRVAFKINGFAKEITCVDESKAAVGKLNAEIKKHCLGRKIKARLGNILKLPFKSNSFGIAYSLWVIHNRKKDWREILMELNMVCKKGGTVIVCFSGGKSDLPKLEAIARHDLKERKAFKGKVLSFLKKLNGNSFSKSVLLPFKFKNADWAFEVFSETFLPKPLPAEAAKKCLAFLKRHSSRNGCAISQECVFAFSFKK